MIEAITSGFNMINWGKRAQAEMSMLMVSLIWGTTFVVVKIVLSEIGPFIFIGLRFVIAFAALSLLSPGSLRFFKASTWSSGFLLGFFLLLGYAFQTIGLKYTSASNAGFITGVSVVIVPIICSLIGRRWPSFRTIVTVVTAVAGLYLLFFQQPPFTLARGDLLVLVGAFGFALHIVFVDLYSHKHNAVAITAIQILLVGVFSLAVGSVVESWPRQLSHQAIGALLITSIFATALAFWVQNIMQKYSTSTRFAIVLTTEPLFAALAAWAWAGEHLTRQAWAGGGLIVLSMIISILTRREKNLVEANV
ncbi:MAG: DMT family transporter [Syntrophomonas sp.]